MIDMRAVRSVIGWMAIAAALASAVLWYKSSIISLDPRSFAGIGGLSAEALELFNQQVRLNGYAALAAASSAVLQAISLSLQP